MAEDRSYREMDFTVIGKENYASSDDDEDTQEAEVHMQKLPFTMDTSCSLMWAMIRRLDQNQVEENGKIALRLGVVAAAFLYILNVCLQIYVVTMMYVFVIERREDPLEVNLEGRTEMLLNAVATGTMFNVTNVTSEEYQVLMVCWNDHTVRYSQSVMIFLWFLKSFLIVQDAYWYCKVSFQLPDAANEPDILSATEDEILVERLTPLVRFQFLGVVLIPRALLTVMLAFMGAKFLLVAQTLGVLIMKSVGLVFISDIDRLVCTSLMHRKEKLELQKAKFHYNEGKPPPHWTLWGVPMAKCLSTFTATMFFTRIVFAEISRFRGACDAYEQMFEQRPKPEEIWVNGYCKTCGFQLWGMTFHF
eukprot:TRINITY_DN18014_c0_g2_i1.p1 TRINITY_DN18014_c0_g2~~TRINITY_DN18014_c0_g2_i1.p1  ORF type:complete len:362 (-),score=91.11 TRINITY_DN18014_c0_g2_i1:46-1131(-)